jgi:hypothetical protein
MAKKARRNKEASEKEACKMRGTLGRSVSSGSSVLGLLLAAASVLGVQAESARRPVTERDIIRMTRLGDSIYLQGGNSKGRVALFSPDGTRFVISVVKGNLENNTNEYSLLLFETAHSFEGPQPVTLLTLASSSNRPAIGNTRWLDSRSITFLGERVGELPQVYRLDLRTRTLEQLTHHPTAVVAYDVTPDGREILYAAERQLRPLVNTREARRNGIIVDTATFLHLLGNSCAGYDPVSTEGEELYLKIGSKAPVLVSMEDRFFPQGALALSPDGRFAIIEGFAHDVPEVWSLYKDRRLQQLVAAERSGDTTYSLRRYSLLDVDARIATPLFDAPSNERQSGFHWMPDSKSIVLSGIHLPLEVPDEAERYRRQEHSFVVEVNVPSRRYTIIADKSQKLSGWNPELKRILLKGPYPDELKDAAVYEKDPDGWDKTDSPLGDRTVEAPTEIVLEEGMNQPPKVFARDIRTGRRNLLLDLNLQLAGVQFAREEIFQWSSSDGHSMRGGLYFPVGHQAGKRYPLVIQTHGFLSERFWPDGPWGSAFAAQAIAAKGIFVLQIGAADDTEQEREAVNTPYEGLREMAAYEGAIEDLNQKGWIDPTRVGIIGFSRTVYHVGYALTHSKYRFRAATFADGMDGGYFQYVLAPYLSPDSYLVNGGRPLRQNLPSWIANAPGFNTERVETPLRIEAYGGFGYLSAWEWYRRLAEEKKPVELIFLPDAQHLLVKPWERLASQGGSVDWFAFWLKDEEDHDQGKRSQYERWRKLRSLLERKTEHLD